MIDIKEILYEITENKAVYEDDIDLIESEILDSYAIIMLINILEDNNVNIRINKDNIDCLRTVKGIENLISKGVSDL